jgi:hypothetical protein
MNSQQGVAMDSTKLPEPDLFTCFDRNMEKRLFHSQEQAKDVAVGPVMEYVSMDTVKTLLATLQPATAPQLTIDEVNKHLSTINTESIALSAGRRENGTIWRFDTIGLDIFVRTLILESFKPFVKQLANEGQPA